MTERQSTGFKHIIGRILRFLILVILLALAVVIGSMLDPLTEMVSEIITTSTHTPTDTPTSTNTPTNTPTRLAKDSPKLSYIILAPENAKLNYDVETGRGTVSWEGSEWMPTEPAETAAIRYELSVTYPEFVLGPFVIYEETSYTFTALNAHRYETVKVFLRAVGALRIGQHEYEFVSDIVEIVWITPTATPSFTPSNTFTPTQTYTATYTSTATDTPTATKTPSATYTNTSTATPTLTPTATSTATDTFTPTATDTSTATNTYTPTSTPTQTDTNTPTHTSTSTATHTFTPSNTPTPTNTVTPSKTSTPTVTSSPTRTYTPTYTYTPSKTFTPTYTPTATFTPSNTPTASITPTNTITFTPSPTDTPDINKMKVLFEVVSRGNVNIRSCPGTHCNPPVAISRRGDVYKVVSQVTGTDGEWYQIRFENRSAYIAGWLTTRTSDATATSRVATAISNKATSDARVAARSRNSRATSTARAKATISSRTTVETGASYRVNFSGLFSTTCLVTPALNPSGVRNVMSIGGDDKYAVEVSIARPGSSTPMSVARETLIDDGVGGKARLMILSSSSRLSPGLYTVRLEKGPYYHEANWRIRNTSFTALVAVCD